jgi:UPF0755 protein
MSPKLRLLARVAAALTLVVLLAAGVAGWWLPTLRLLASPMHSMKPAPPALGGARTRVATIIPRELQLVLLARVAGTDRSIKAGNYEITEGITLPELLDRLTQGDVTQVAMTIVEGAGFAELKAMLAANPDVTKTVLDLPDAELMRRVGAPSASPEGWFFPDTYLFAAGSADLASLARAHRLMRARLTPHGEAHADLLNDPYEALILASIVESGNRRAADRPLIASVSSTIAPRHAIAERSNGDLRPGAAFDGTCSATSTPIRPTTRTFTPVCRRHRLPAGEASLKRRRTHRAPLPLFRAR